MVEVAEPGTGESKSQIAYRWIKERIASGAYTPGYRLVLGQIAKQLGISVVPVREAIRLLEAEQLVTFERNVGAQVAMPEETEYLHTMQMLSVVEGYATALAAPELPAAAVTASREINRQMVECLDKFDPHRFTQLNREFHTALFEHCPNPHVLDQVRREWSRLDVLRDSTFSFIPGRAHESVKEHEAILDLIEQGADVAEIEATARRHRLATLDAFLAYQGTHKKHP